MTRTANNSRLQGTGAVTAVLRERIREGREARTRRRTLWRELA
jgi:hypothetical protein